MKKAIICTASIVLFACTSGKITQEKATEAAHIFVKEKLKAPETATFSEENWKETGPNAYAVSGKVDGQNSFGAKVREDYIVKMKYLGGDYHDRQSWQVDAIQVW